MVLYGDFKKSYEKAMNTYTDDKYRAISLTVFFKDVNGNLYRTYQDVSVHKDYYDEWFNTVNAYEEWFTRLKGHYKIKELNLVDSF